MPEAPVFLRTTITVSRVTLVAILIFVFAIGCDSQSELRGTEVEPPDDLPSPTYQAFPDTMLWAGDDPYVLDPRAYFDTTAADVEFWFEVISGSSVELVEYWSILRLRPVQPGRARILASAMRADTLVDSTSFSIRVEDYCEHSNPADVNPNLVFDEGQSYRYHQDRHLDTVHEARHVGELEITIHEKTCLPGRNVYDVTERFDGHLVVCFYCGSEGRDSTAITHDDDWTYVVAADELSLGSFTLFFPDGRFEWNLAPPYPDTLQTSTSFGSPVFGGAGHAEYTLVKGEGITHHFSSDRGRSHNSIRLSSID